MLDLDLDGLTKIFKLIKNQLIFLRSKHKNEVFGEVFDFLNTSKS